MLNQLEFEEKKASKVKLVTRIYSNFILKYPYIPILLTFIISFGLIVLSCYLYGMWPTCNQNYYHWSGDDISEKWLSYLASTKNTYASLHKLLTTTFSIPYQFDLAQTGAIFYQRRNTKKSNNILPNHQEPHMNNSNINIFNQNNIKNLNGKIYHQDLFNTNVSKLEIDESENVLTLESLRTIWDIEEKMHQTKGWADYCYKVPKDILATFMQPFLDELLDYMKDHLSELEEGTNCLAFKSIITEFKSYMRKKLNISNPKSSDLTNEIIYNYIHGYDDLNRSIEKRLKMTYFGTDYNNMKTTLIRSLVLSGHPVKGYDSKSDRFDEQRKIIGKWQIEFLKPLYDQINNKSSSLYPSAAFPYEIEYEIFDIVLQHLPYFGGVVFILIILICITFKSIFLGVFGMVGALLTIFLSVSIVNIIFQIHYFDVLFSMALFMSCILLNLCNMFIYSIYKNNKSFLYLVEKATKVMIITLLLNSFTFLPTLYFGTKVGQYFGFYCFILILNSFVLIFTWHLPLLSLYSKIKTKKFKIESLYSLNTILLTSVDEDETNLALSQISNAENSIENSKKIFSFKKSNSAMLVNREKRANPNLSYTNSKSVSDLTKPSNNNNNDSEQNSESNNIESNSQFINTTSASNSNSNTSTNIFSYAETLEDYPHQNLFDFFKMKVTFNVNCCNQFPSNFIEKTFCYHIWPFVYFYRAIFILICVILLSMNIYFVSQINTKSDFAFLKKNHRIQRALDTATDAFMNPLNDNAFVYVWGLNKKSSKPYKSWATIDDYGYHKSFNKGEVNLNMITDSRTQNHIMETWQLLMNNTEIIDSYQSEYFGFNPWEIWDMIANTDFGPFSFIFKFLNFTEPPTNVSCITPEQYHSYLYAWQLLLSLKTMQEADNYVPGTLLRNTIGFSYTDYSLQFIAMKANMFLTKHNSKKELKIQYDKAKEIEKIIQEEAAKKGIPDFKGWVTSAAWMPLAVEENITKNTLIIFFTSLILTIFGPLFFVSYKMSVVVFIGSLGSILFTLGTLKIVFDWELGLNEALMIAVSNGFVSVFFHISSFDAFSKSNIKLPKFGKIQIALVNSSVPMLVIVFLLLVSIPILIFCPFQLFPPFTIFLFFDALFCVLWGIIISPIILYCIL